MNEWQHFQGDAAAWDCAITSLPGSTVYQRHGWGEFKRSRGWIPLRLVAPGAAAQVLLRSYGGIFHLAWVPGGPAGEAGAWAHRLPGALGCLTYWRINALRRWNEPAASILRAARWELPRHPMLSGLSLELDVQEPTQGWLPSIDSKHRYYVRRSIRNGIAWTFGNTKALRRDFSLLAQRLAHEKQYLMRERDETSLDDLSRHLPDGVRFLVGRLGNEAVTGCLVLVHGRRAEYASAATVGRGRDASAAYGMILELRDRLRDLGVAHLDFGGVDPRTPGAWGVDHFKRGFGGKEIRHLGEWQFSRLRLLGAVADRLISSRQIHAP